jgi:TetR/AcrR family transcriptional repressor of nem operon
MKKNTVQKKSVSDTAPLKGPGTRQRLLDTAMELIWRSSYGAVSVDDICAKAGAQKGSFYHYFPCKADLAVTALEAFDEEARPEVEAMFAKSVPPAERFARLADMIIAKQEEAAQRFNQVCGCPFAALGSEIAGNNPAIAAKIQALFARHHQFLEAALRELEEERGLPGGVDPSSLAAQVSAYLIGQVTMSRIYNSLELLRRDLKSGLLRMIGEGHLTTRGELKNAQ